MKENLDEFHWHEALDRASMAGTIFETMMQDHPAIQQTPELAEKVDAISNMIAELYQSIGTHCFKEET